MSVHGYDPARMLALRTHVIDAVEGLRRVRCDDPAAGDAMAAVRLVRHTLECSWMPAIDAIHASTAMIRWQRAGTLDTAAHRAIVGLVRHLGAASQWIPTSGLEHLEHHQLRAELLDAARGLHRAVVTGMGDLAATTVRLGRLVDETLDRARADRAVFTSLVRSLVAPTDVARLLDTLEKLGEASRSTGHPGGTSQDAARSLAVLLGAISSVDAGALDVLVERAAVAPTLVDAVLDDPGAFEPALVLALAVELVGHLAGVGRWRTLPRVGVELPRVQALVELVARRPADAAALLAVDEVGAALLTDHRFDPDVVERLAATGLGAAARGDALGLGASTLAGIVSLTRTAELSAGARRGLALALGSYLPALAVQLDVRRSVVIVVGDEPSAATVDLGTYRDVARLVGQILDDVTAQLALGVTVGAFRRDQAAVGIDAVRRRTTADPAAAGHLVGGALADVGRVVRLLADARAGRDDLLAFRHGLAQAQATQLVAMFGLGAGVVTPGGAPLARLVSSLTTRGITTAIGRTTPRTTPRVGLETELSIDLSVTIVSMPLREPDLRASFGLHAVPDTTWATLGELVTRLERETDPDARQALHARVMQVMAANPDLDAFAENVRLRAGDASR